MAGLQVASFPSPDPRPAHGVLGNISAFAIGGVIFSVMRLCYPLAMHAGSFEHGVYAWVQLPLVIVLVCIVSAVIAARRRSRGATVLGALVAYLGCMLLTNDLAFAFRVNHTNDFPIQTGLDSLDWRNNPTTNDVLRVAGVPLAQGVFSSADAVLPPDVRENMEYWKRNDALIFVYYEADKWGRAATHYVLFETATGEQFSQVTLNRPVPREFWPGPSVQRTR